MDVERRPRSTLLVRAALLLLLALGHAGCGEFRFQAPKTPADASGRARRAGGVLGVLYPADERPSEDVNAMPVGAYLPVPYVRFTIDRPERFVSMSNNNYRATDRPLRLQLQDVVVTELVRAGVFDTVIPVPSGSNFRSLGCDYLLKLTLRSTRAEGAVPTYFVTYLGASALYLAGFPYWVGTQKLYIDAELLTLESFWKKSYEEESEKSWRGIYGYGEDPAVAVQRLLAKFVGELLRDLGTVAIPVDRPAG
jgi:hypothetical protein